MARQVRFAWSDAGTSTWATLGRALLFMALFAGADWLIRKASRR